MLAGRVEGDELASVQSAGARSPQPTGARNPEPYPIRTCGICAKPMSAGTGGTGNHPVCETDEWSR
jgi:hypothetical protein